MNMWIWNLNTLISKYGSIDALISKLKAMNVKDVCIKYHEGSGPTTNDGTNFQSLFQNYVSYFKNAGFVVGTWGYNYFNHVQEEANMIIAALNESDYYLFDPEVDVSGKSNQAEQICQLIRQAHPNAIIGYSSFPIVDLHQDIPYSVFDKYCDFASPQIYWGEMEWNINTAIDKTISDHKAYGLNKPIYPSIQTYKLSSGDYDTYMKYGFDKTYAWSMDESDDVFENFCVTNPHCQATTVNKKVYVPTDTIVCYNDIPDGRAAGYLADCINCNAQWNDRKYDYSKYKDVICIGAGPFTDYCTKVITGSDRYETMQLTLNLINQIRKERGY